MVEENVLITSRSGKKLDGFVRKSQGDGPFPAVIFVPGFGMTMHEWNNSFDEIADRLASEGIMTVQFQFPIFDTKGRCREMSISKRAEIFDDVILWVKTRADVDTDRIGILAQSYGVPTALNVDLSFAKTLACIGGAYYSNKTIARVYEELDVKIDYDSETTLPPSSGENTTVGKEFWQENNFFDPIEKMKSLTMPVFLVHGEKDTKVTTAEVRKVYNAIPGEKKKLKIFVGGDHGIIDVPRQMREEFLKDVVQWFKETLIS